MTIPVKPFQRDEVVRYAKKRAPRPILIGDVALNLGWWSTIRKTEELLEEMVEDGVLRRATEAECRTYDIKCGYFLV